MSGFLASVAGAAGSGLVSQVLGLIQTAAFRGVVFGVFDVSHGGGRRWAQFLFPQRRDVIQEDMGAVDGPIEVNAVLIGDDYVRRANRLLAALQAPGPAMLRHPWLGEIKVTAVGEPRFTFDHQKMRLCTVTMTFRRWAPEAPIAPNSLAALLDAIDQLIDTVQIMLADALAPLGTALGLLSMVQSALATVGSAVNGVIGRAPSGGVPGLSPGSPGAVPGGVAAIAAASAGPVDAMTGGVALVPGAGIGGQASGLMAAVALAIADAGDAGQVPALGPGPGAVAALPADPRAAASILLAIAPLPAPGAPAEVAAILLAARVLFAAAAARAASLITWTSRDEALAWRAQVDARLAAVQAELVASTGLRTGAAWLAVRSVRATWSADVQERAGRLPAVRHLVTLQPMSAWLIAQAVAGDVPGAVRPAMLDLVSRNRIRHPGYVPAGRLEILVA